MKHLFSLRNFLLLIILVLLGYIIYLLGGFGSDTTKVEVKKIKFYFNKEPSAQYLDSLTNYFESEFNYQLSFYSSTDSLYYSKNSNPNTSLIIPIQNNSKTTKLPPAVKPCIDTECKILYALVVTRPGPQGMPPGKVYKKLLQFIRLHEFPQNLKNNLAYFETIVSITPK